MRLVKEQSFCDKHVSLCVYLSVSLSLEPSSQNFLYIVPVVTIQSSDIVMTAWKQWIACVYCLELQVLNSSLTTDEAQAQVAELTKAVIVFICYF